jgi:hypothetical protein
VTSHGTTSDLVARSSHRGGQGFSSSPQRVAIPRIASATERAAVVGRTREQSRWTAAICRLSRGGSGRYTRGKAVSIVPGGWRAKRRVA